MPQNQLATSTFDLLERVRAGDESAFTSLFHKYSSRLAVLIRYKLSADMRARVEVDDILQETFLAANTPNQPPLKFPFPRVIPDMECRFIK
ncbi:MAG: RNA polymerase sigma factor [Terriglobia bacterium]